MKEIVLFSGGMDSTVALHDSVSRCGAENVIALSMAYGQRHAVELAAAEAIAHQLGVELMLMDLTPIFESHDSHPLFANGNADLPTGTYSEQLAESEGELNTYVPFRNGLFITVAASIAMQRDVDRVVIANHAEKDGGYAYSDCTDTFISAADTFLQEGSGAKITISAPFTEMTKADIAYEGLSNGAAELIDMSWSCYEGADEPCNKCSTCLDRNYAIQEAKARISKEDK